LPRQLDDVAGQPLLVVPAPWNLPLGERCCPSIAQARCSDTASVQASWHATGTAKRRHSARKLGIPNIDLNLFGKLLVLEKVSWGFGFESLEIGAIHIFCVAVQTMDKPQLTDVVVDVRMIVRRACTNTFKFSNANADLCEA
jgi:hypothetical protein